MEDQIFIQHRFKVSKDGLDLQDAIVLPLDEYNVLTKKEIEDIKTERFDNFKETIENPPVKPEPSKEDKIASIDKDLASLDEQKAQLLSMKSELNKAEIKPEK